MSEVWNLITEHTTEVALVTFWIGSNIVSALPSPTNDTGMFYKFLFALAHGLAGSIPRVLPGLRLPIDPTHESLTYFSNGSKDPKS